MGTTGENGLSPSAKVLVQEFTGLTWLCHSNALYVAI